ncbi:MAG TPA: glycosyltransferase [Gemmataceae bacterium]|nr:glycosyltransferase [Gemmataceae bacterium]
MSEHALKRILMYVPHVVADGSRRYLVETARALAAAARNAGRDFRVLGRAFDSAGYPVPWPASVFAPLRAVAPPQREANSVPQSLEDDFRQLVQEAGPFDVLYLPQPWGCLPTEHGVPLPAPVVAGLGDLLFDRFDFGARTDRFRREMERLTRAACGFVFGSDAVRREVVDRYGLDADGTYVVHRVAHFREGSAEGARRHYRLPLRFALMAGWTRPAKDGLTLVRALAHLRRQGPLPLPVVVVRGVLDAAALAGPDQQEYAARCRREAAEAGLEEDRDLIDLGVVDEEDVPALVAAASVLVAPAGGAAGLGFSLLTALACGTPVLHARIPPLTERLGEDGAFALGFSPDEPAELAARLREVAAAPEAALARARRAREQFPNHSYLSAPGERLLEVLDRAAGCPWLTRPQSSPGRVPRDKRVAWLISHTTFRDAEVPLLRSLGLEVYTNKVLPPKPREEYRSNSVDFSWDDDSTLPPHVLNHFNRFSFYEDRIDPETAELLNGYFGTVICAPDAVLVRELVKHYRGRILIRACGLDHPRRFGDLFDKEADGWFWTRLWQIQHRVWLAPSYDSIPLIEERLLRERSVVLPLALPERILRAGGSWRGGDRRVFFVCPSIHSTPLYYGQIYERFKQTYGDLPHVIGGNQPLPVPDPCVLGFVPEERMVQMYRTLQVMYYHSREPRHLHYHPLEAIAFGMPVIYMRGGLMEAYDKGSQAGACDTDAEARDKLSRVLAGDQAFIRDVQEGQQTILEPFLPDRVREQWETLFVDQVLRTECLPDGSLAAEAAAFCSPLAGNERFGCLEGPEIPAERLTPPEARAVPAEPSRRPRSRAGRLIDAAVCEPARWGYSAFQVAWLYAQAALRQRTFLPAATGIYRYLPARVQQSAVFQAVGQCRPGRKTRFVDPEAVRADHRYLVDPPSLPPRRVGAGTAALLRLRQSLAAHDATLVVDPVGLLNPDFDPSLLSEEPLVLLWTDSALDGTDALGTWTPAAVRERELWCRLASRVVFGSEEDRYEALRRGGIPAERTRVVPASVLSGGVAPASAREVRAFRERWALPDRFLLGVDSPRTRDNTLLLFQAAQVLRWRGYAFPPLVLTGAEPRRRPERLSAAYRKELERSRAAARLTPGEDLFLVHAPEDPAHGVLEGAALVAVVTDRWSAHASRQVCRAALQRCPVIACDTPFVREQWGPSGDCVLLLPADDPVALADALVYTLEHPEETARRVERAHRRARADNDPRWLAFVNDLLEEVAAEAGKGRLAFRTRRVA